MLATLVALAAVIAGSAQIRVEPANDGLIIRAADAGSAELTIRVDSDDPSLPDILGTQTTQGRDRIFTPRFPLQPGVRYRASVANGAPFVFEVPRGDREVAVARVTRVYPSGALLPENQLKFYIEFATPMARGEAYRRIRLLDARGAAIELPFLELQEELWDERQQRFTLYFDPGRVKSELVPNREVGTPLHAGERYTLAVDAGWKDASGRPMGAEFRKSFTVAARDTSSPDPQRWQVVAPKGGSKDTLAIDFTEPLEHALALRMIEVRDARNQRVTGNVSLTNGESHWSFTPTAAWDAGIYTLVIDATLEDLAGNKVSRPFEVAIRSDAERKAAPTFVTREVVVK